MKRVNPEGDETAVLTMPLYRSWVRYVGEAFLNAFVNRTRANH